MSVEQDIAEAIKIDGSSAALQKMYDLLKADGCTFDWRQTDSFRTLGMDPYDGKSFVVMHKGAVIVGEDRASLHYRIRTGITKAAIARGIAAIDGHDGVKQRVRFLK